MIIKRKNFSDLPQSPKAEEAYKKWKESGKDSDARKFMDIWTKEVYIPARKKGIFVDPDPNVVSAAERTIKGAKKVEKKK